MVSRPFALLSFGGGEGRGSGWCCTGVVIVVVSGGVSLLSTALVVVGIVERGLWCDCSCHHWVRWKGSWWWFALVVAVSLLVVRCGCCRWHW